MKGKIKMIKISQVIPILKPGYVARDRNGDIYWYEQEPEIMGDVWQEVRGACESFKDFGCLQEIEPWAEDWKQSLIEIKVGGE